MSTIHFPTTPWKPCIPAGPSKLAKEESWFLGVPIRWLIACEQKSSIKKIGAYALALLVMTSLIYSWIGIPLVFFGVKEWIEQKERIRYETEYETLRQWIDQSSRLSFLKGRINPIETASIDLTPQKRFEIIEAINKRDSSEFPIEKLRGYSNTSLLILVATMWEDYMHRFKLCISVKK